MKVVHVHELTGISGSENALLPALRSSGIDARFIGLDVPGSDALRFYGRLDELGVPYRRVRCGPDVSPRTARDFIRAVRAERPDLLHTHLVHADVYGAIAADLCLRRASAPCPRSSPTAGAAGHARARTKFSVRQMTERTIAVYDRSVA